MSLLYSSVKLNLEVVTKVEFLCSADLGAHLNPSGCSLSVVGPIRTVVSTPVPPVPLIESQAAAMEVMSQSSAVSHEN